ncbi:MAG: TfoX/Sxy family protein [Bacteroidetes bacterium]|nr:TfoX/Sxy family protein [Bacteroidota bacterium]MBL6964113.1 TfoX/Sxy family protein [Bacteroidota bacterium]
MAYDELLAGRLKLALDRKGVHYEEKKMFGGVALMVDDKMCIGVIKGDIMARIDPEIHEKSLAKPGCREMDFTKRPMKGFVYLNEEGFEQDSDLDYWVGLALDYNPKAKASKKKK